MATLEENNLLDLAVLWVDSSQLFVPTDGSGSFTAVRLLFIVIPDVRSQLFIIHILNTVPLSHRSDD